MRRIEIESMTLGPYGVGHLEGKTVMVPNTAPQDLIEAEIIAERPAYARARVGQVVRPAPVRRTPPCPFLPRCGGCDWQHLDYSAQLQIKGELLAREFERRLEVKLEPRGLVEPSPREWAYRSRVRLKMGAEGVLGYHELESNRLVAIERCLVATTELDAAQKFLRETHLRATELEIVGKHAAQVLIVHCAAFNDGHLKRAARALEQDSRLAGLVLKSSSRRVVLGDAALAYEPEDGYEIVADADSFSQVNLAQNQKLVATVMEFAAPAPALPLLDLFCGAGNFSLPAARRGAPVTGVDSDELAIAAARRNAQRMNLPNAQFIATPAASTAQFLHRAKYHPAVVLLDPPRTGAAALLEPLARLRAPQIIYVSCDPHTLIRDLRALIAYRYKLSQLRAFDFFPHTHHVELAVR